MRFKKISKDYINHLGLSSDTVEFLTTVGLPIDFNDLQQAIEINFYFDNEKIVKKEFDRINYVIIGDDSGTKLGISLHDNKLFAVDFSNSLGIDSVCFINSDIEKFIKSMMCFIDLKVKSKNNETTTNQLRELLKVELTNIDNNAVSNDRTWWTQIIDDPIID